MVLFGRAMCIEKSWASVPDGGPECEAECNGEDDLQEAEPLGRGRHGRHRTAGIEECRGHPDQQ
jgi:hypothetical protein